MSEFTRQALGLLRKAGEDFHAAACLRKDSGTSLWTIGFHAQQAVEKALKAVLMQRGIRYPFTHDIEALIDLVENGSLPLPPDSRELSCLTPFGTLYRYEDEEWGLPASVSVDRMVSWAETTVGWARSLLGEDDG